MANNLEKYNVKINIIKIPSHIGIQGNIMADSLAKQAAAIAHNCKCKLDNIIEYNTFFNPINVDIQKDLILLNRIGYKDNKIGKMVFYKKIHMLEIC